ncbi:MAG: DUF2075 domain-containing protein [Succiniclasticum sp.]|jgi:uncharacterized protein
MIIYESDLKKFSDAVDDSSIDEKLAKSFRTKLGYPASPNEQRSWRNSLRFMETIVRKAELPEDCGVLIEYTIPSTQKRIDFLVSGEDEKEDKNFVIVELKQWEKADKTDKEFLVKTFVGGNEREVPHPSYQARSYKRFLRDMNSAVEEKSLNPSSCSYLHNYKKENPEPLLAPQYKTIYDDTPVFFKSDTKKLEEYLKERVGAGRGMQILDDLARARIRPSKKLIDAVSEMYKGNEVFTLLDDQQVAYANIVKYALEKHKKRTLIINGNPGTGKSVVAMNAFVKLLKEGKDIRFIAPNAAFRSTIMDMLARHHSDSKKRLGEIFLGSSRFYATPLNAYEVLLVDEAHRLKRAGAYQYRGESQVDDIIRSSWVNIFFIDDNQRIRPEDEGSVALIKKTAAKYGSEVREIKLASQFRCAGADGYILWLKDVLQIERTGNYDGWDEQSFECKIMDSPWEVEQYVAEKAASGAKARMLAGYAWKWTSAKEGNPDAQILDIEIPEFHYKRAWNSRSKTNEWPVNEDMRDQIGCIHTAQGLEFDYVGVIIGKDLAFDSKTGTLHAVYDNYYDKTGKKGLKDKPEELTKLVKNIYMVLLSRGMKGCAIYCCDDALRAYFKERRMLGRSEFSAEEQGTLRVAEDL